MGEPDGYCKVVVADGDQKDAAGVEIKDRQILGCHIFGAHSADIVQEIAAQMNFNATAESLAHIIHAHPTLSEVILTAVRQ